MGTIGQDLTKSVKSTAKNSGKKALYEPVEVLKAAGDQITGAEKAISSFESKEFYEKSESKENGVSNEDRENLEAKRRKMLQDLEEEIASIVRQNEERNKLRLERMQKDEVLESTPSIEPPSKPSRQISIGMEGKLDKLKRKSEVRMPPSG